MNPIAFNFTKIFVGDLDAAEHFYTEAIGMKVVMRVSSDAVGFVLKETFLTVSGMSEGNQLGLVQYLDRPMPPIGEAWTGFMVPDIEATVAAVERLGGKTILPVTDTPEYSIRGAVIADPEGHVIELMQPMTPA